MFLAASTLTAFAEDPSKEQHWSLTPVVKPTAPTDSNPIDFFTGRQLKKAGLQRNERADRYTLLRRITLDLTGLPPTRTEIENFISDDSGEAWESVVDRLLASPHYGERWGRHWLDVARYVQGTVKVPGIDEIDLAAPYRDYVVRAFNSDKPYDRFIAEQLAGDLLGEENETETARIDRLTAPAFLSIGPWFEECTDPNKLRLDIIDEQISTTTRAFLAHDFACSRCHDHKFDPIPTRDYYALAGIFRSTEITSNFAEEWKDGRPRLVKPLGTREEQKNAAAHEAALQGARIELRSFLESIRSKVLLREKFPVPGKIDGEVVAFEAEDFAGHKNLRTTSIGPGAVIESRKALDRWVKYRIIIPEPGDYTLLVRYAAVVPSPVTLELELKDQPGEVLGRPTHSRAPDGLSWQPLSLKGLEKGSLHIRFKVDRNVPFPVLDTLRLVKGTLSEVDTSWRRALGEPSISDTRYYLNGAESEQLRAIEERIRRLHETRPDLDLTLAAQDSSIPVNLPVHTGGNVYQTESDPVPRGVPQLAEHIVERDFEVRPDDSGREQLAAWLSHPDHPLTARVMVNRIWHWHFGTGLVRTPDDFGKQGAKPTHPDLLDWLAAEFVESDWSIKHIQRLILTSDTYRISSNQGDESLARDPDGSLFSRYPKRRLEVEAIYDSMLSTTGKVPRQSAGQPLDTGKSKDRALYILTSSRSPMGLGMEIRKMFGLFGFDPSGRPMHDRDASVTPAQALWWLNNPLPRYYAEKFAEQLLEEFDDPAERTAAAHETTLGRPPTQRGERAFLTYVDELTDAGETETEAWTRACLGLFSTKSFQTLD